MNKDRRTWFLISIGGALILVALVSITLSGAMMGPGIMWEEGAPHQSGWAWGMGMALGWLGMVALWGALVAGMVLLGLWLLRCPQGIEQPHSEDALSILRRRYASGEIDQATYEYMRWEIETDARTPLTRPAPPETASDHRFSPPVRS